MAWHRHTGATNKQAVDTRTLASRRRLGVSRFTMKLNTPVQGTGADGLKLALIWERCHEAPRAFPSSRCRARSWSSALRTEGQAEGLALALRACPLTA
jgi:DNA polymerase-1